MSVAEVLLAIALGVSLAAAVGFRVFVPLLVLSIAAKAGVLELSPALDWVGSPLAIIMLSVAAIAEVAAYYLPGVDNLLDALAMPMALVAGSLVAAAPIWDQPPLLKWTAAVIAGGGAAVLTQGLSSMLRAKSTLVTGGLGNPVIATAELGGSLLVSVLALLLPVVALCTVLISVFVLFRLLRKLVFRTPPRPAS